MATATNNGSTNTNTSGQSSVAFDYVLKKGGDCLPDETMAEITRRTIGAVISGEFGDVIFSKDPPNDTKKLWVEESNTGANIGTIKRYESATGTWVDDHFTGDDPSASLNSGDVVQRKVQSFTPSAAQIVSTFFVDVDGSEIAFQPVILNSFIEYVYRFQFSGDAVATNGSVIHLELEREAAIEAFSQHSIMSGGTGVYGDATINYGHIMNSWGPTEQSLVLSARVFANSNQAQLHSNNYWNGALNQSVLTQAQLIITEYKK